MAETKYYMGNDIEIERGVVVKSTGENFQNQIEVVNELGNGSGWVYSVAESDLVQITKSDYDLMIACIMDWDADNQKIVHAKIEEILGGKNND